MRRPTDDGGLTYSLDSRLDGAAANPVALKVIDAHFPNLALPRQTFQEILALIARLRAPPAPA